MTPAAKPAPEFPSNPPSNPVSKPASKPAGSRGRESVAAALAALACYRPEPAERPPAFDYRLPAAPGPGPRTEAPRALPAPEPDGSGTGPRTIAGAAADLRAGRVTSRELVEEALDAVGARDPSLHAIAHLLASSARAGAAAADAELAAGHRRGRLHGIPVTVKDVIHVAGAPTRAGSAVFEALPGEDADAVARLRAAGAIVLAKTTTHEFALGVTTPQSRNPHDPTRIPGGSSGGSAIAVATGMGLGSLATDTRASIRCPAALCGVVGLKPTFGAVPARGIVPLSWTMDHLGPLAATVADAAILLDVLTGAAVGAGRVSSWAGASVAGLRIGVPEATFAGAGSALEGAVRSALQAAAGLGCLVTEAARPGARDLDDANAAGLIVSRCEAATFHRGLGADRSQYWDEVADQLSAAEGVSALDYIDAQRLRADLTQGLLSSFADRDVLAMPTVPVVAPPVEDFARYLLVLSRNTSLWSLTGFPALSVPCGMVDGLPVGLQLVAPPWREDRLIALGSALQGTAVACRAEPAKILRP